MIENWRNSALCAQSDPDAWFPEKGAAPPYTQRRICNSCPVRQECLDEALDMGYRYGIWGGTTHRQRLGKYRDQPVHPAGDSMIKDLVQEYTRYGMTAKQIAERLKVDKRTVVRTRSQLRTEEVA